MSKKTIVPTDKPEVLRYRGNQIVAIRRVPDSFGPGADVWLDLKGDGAFERPVRADKEGWYTFCLDAAQLPANGEFSMGFRLAKGEEKSEVVRICTIQEDPYNPASEVPLNCLPGKGDLPEPEICTCIDCLPGGTLIGSSLGAYTDSYTPAAYGVELATGKLRWDSAITSFGTRMLGFGFSWHHASLTHYDGPWGLGGSQSFNMMIVQTGPLTGQAITPDLRVYDISSKDGTEWTLPRGFFSKLRLDSERCRWTMTHFSGLEVQFFQAILNRPGYPVSIREPNGNLMRLEYDASGLLQRIVTDLNQIQTLTYGANARLQSFTDHLQRTWRFGYDDRNRLTRIATPTTEYADIASRQEITDKELAHVLVQQPRTMKLSYTDERFPSHITAVTDQRGATPEARIYDDQGRLKTAMINGKQVQYLYNADFRLAKLEETNLVTRVIDREGNVNDYEIHGQQGGPVKGRGRFGLRRKITWTERGKGNSPLRDDEPAYWEQRWLHDCKCLSPQVVVQPFSSDDAARLTFDELGIPTNWPRTIYTHNGNRQVTVDLYTDGIESIRKEMAYQESAFGSNRQYSRLVKRTDPRAFDGNSIYAGLNFEHTYRYDERGNRIRHDSPTVTRGVDAPQIITESWTYNEFGQVLQSTDPNGNLTVNSYYDGPSSSGDINSKGMFGGYLASTTVGAQGSKDAATNLTTTFKVNPLGMTTQRIDPNGFAYDTEYNDLQEKTRWIEPPVTLRNGSQVRYETRWIYDGAGNMIMERRSNIDLDGSVPANAWIDRSMSYDDVNNLLSERVEVDAADTNDLISRYAYDNNDQRIATRKPEGNREFLVYDERRLLFKTFYGVATGTRIDEGYPVDKRVQDLVGTAFIGLMIETYDGRGNHIRHRDGRGNFTNRFYDFYNRQIAESDPNGNGWVREFDDASNVLTTERGAVAMDTGQITQVLERTYGRFDEIGRGYQQVRDIDLSSDERTAVDPDDGRNSSYLTRFDPGSRPVRKLDANGNPTSYFYDAANRQLSMADALSNVRAQTYDANSNLVQVNETELPGPGASGMPETYVTTFAFDELNRLTEQHIRGLNGDSIDHATFFAYDSRSNRRLMQDAEANVTLKTFDDANRMVVQQRFDGDPFAGSPAELQHSEWAYDRNSRVTEERVFSEVTDPASVQVTRHAYDDLDRRVRTVFPDSDDPVDGSSNGPDRIFDRVEMRYDANSNVSGVTDQRGVVFVNTFDPGNRLTVRDITRPDNVPGVARQTYLYDALNRIVDASNDYARVERGYDPLSRLENETQSIRLDGSGFTNAWEEPIQIAHIYDRQSNQTACRVLDTAKTDVAVSTTFDALNRQGRITAQYFGTPMHDIATYRYLGPRRVQTKSLGNGAALTCTYDAKRRTRSHQWTGPAGLLVGFEYDYDRMDNALYERFAHDNGLFDHFQYNDRYEVINVEYRVAGATPPANPRTLFFYDDMFNRTQASFGDPFGADANTLDSYTSNEANEYIQVKRNGQSFSQAHDLAGNMTRLLVKPATDQQHPDVLATARWDAFNLLFDIDTGVTPRQHYRYDAFRRRIVTLELDGSAVQPGSRRYIYDGWDDVEERLFDDGATLTTAPSRLERIYVNGRQIDEPLLTAIDGNEDRQLGGNAPKNVPGSSADQEYYFLNNRLGSVMALLDADRADRVLELYRYTVYGEATAFLTSHPRTPGRDEELLQPGVNLNPSASNGLSAFSNVLLFTARRLDNPIGLYYYRNRYYEVRQGRFVSRDPIGYEGGCLNLYQYVGSRPINYIDPMGLLKDTPLSHKENTDWGWVTFDDSYVEFGGKIQSFDSCFDESFIGIDLTVSDFRDEWVNDTYQSHLKGNLHYRIECNPCQLIMEKGIRVQSKNVSIAGGLTIQEWDSPRQAKPLFTESGKHRGRCCCCFDVSIDISYNNNIVQGGGGSFQVFVLGSGGGIGSGGGTASGGGVGKTWTLIVCGCERLSSG